MILQVVISVLCLTLSVSSDQGVAPSSSNQCETLHPAMLNQEYGFDETKLTARDNGGLARMEPIPSARKHQILHFTCEGDRSFTRNKVTYQVPDGVSTDSSPGGSVFKFSKCYDDADKLKAGIISAIENWESSPFGSLNTDASSDNYLADSRCLTSIHFDFKGFNAGLEGRRFQLDADFENDFNALPENGGSASAYSEFIGKYGTGYFSTGYYGSRIHVYVITPTKFDDPVNTVKSAVFSYEGEIRDVGISKWIKGRVPPKATVLVRTSVNGDSWSSVTQDFTGGTITTFGSYSSFLPKGDKSKNLAKAIEEYIKWAGMERNWRSDWAYPKQ